MCIGRNDCALDSYMVIRSTLGGGTGLAPHPTSTLNSGLGQLSPREGKKVFHV